MSLFNTFLKTYRSNEADKEKIKQWQQKRLISLMRYAKAFDEAKRQLMAFFESKGLSGMEFSLSDEAPQANKTSGKFKHIYADY